ncbi:MAG: DUF973 family protein [Thermoplasmata archaeon]
MAARFCSHCGRPVPANASFCASCGAAVASTYAPPYAPTAPPGVAPPLSFGSPAPYSPYPPRYPRPAETAPGSPESDRSALSNVTLAAILGLVAAALSYVWLFASPATSLFGASAVGSSTSVTLSLAALYYVVGVAGVGVVIGLLELWIYRQAFATLAVHDRRFSTPAALVLMALVAVMILAVIGAALVTVLYEAVTCAGVGNPITSSCLNVGTLLGLILLSGVVAIIAFVGYIGLLLGIWRLGSYFDEDTFKIGAILLIIPLLNFVGLILILVAARSAARKIDGPPGYRF